MALILESILHSNVCLAIAQKTCEDLDGRVYYIPTTVMNICENGNLVLKNCDLFITLKVDSLLVKVFPFMFMLQLHL